MSKHSFKGICSSLMCANIHITRYLSFLLLDSSIVAIMLQLLGLPSLYVEAMVLYAQVLALAAAVIWLASTSPLGA